MPCVSVTRFGADVDILKHFGEYMSTENGGFVLQHLQFDQKRTNFVKVNQAINVSQPLGLTYMNVVHA